MYYLFQVGFDYGELLYHELDFRHKQILGHAKIPGFPDGQFHDGLFHAMRLSDRLVSKTASLGGLF
jgi:hypothetical protein